jgi:hypothetical protein
MAARAAVAAKAAMEPRAAVAPRAAMEAKAAAVSWLGSWGCSGLGMQPYTCFS